VPPAPRHEAGFTLIELMIVVAAIAILAGVALPAYRGAMQKARRTDARTALMTASQMLERFNTENNTFVGASFGSSSDAVYRSTSENGYYALALSGLGVRTYTISAVPTGTQASDACGTFTLDVTGVRGVSGGTLTAADCW
jgi:type IV pilus assembly protein PilE